MTRKFPRPPSITQRLALAAAALAQHYPLASPPAISNWIERARLVTKAVKMHAALAANAGPDQQTIWQEHDSKEVAALGHTLLDRIFLHGIVVDPHPEPARIVVDSEGGKLLIPVQPHVLLEYDLG